MSFGPDHYVPVLKVKRGEKTALGLVAAASQDHMTPLLEVVERKKEKTLAAHIETAFKDLAKNLSGYSRCFLDARELAPDGPSASAAVFGRAKAERISFTPVTGIERSEDVAAALSYRTQGFALRLTRDEFERGTLRSTVPEFLGDHGLAPEEVDLIVDFGAADDMVVEGILRLTDAFLADVPHHRRWLTLTVSGSAFPSSMGRVGRNSHVLVERSEWIAWRDGLFALRGDIERLPTYSDCAIQHPAGVEDFDPRLMAVSASIRYTESDDWLLIKGQSTRKTPAKQQFPQLSTQLVYGSLRSRFAGGSHCRGCQSMWEAANGVPRLGSAEVWRRLGTIHHLTCVTEELPALFWP
ncbi:MAG: hypothetical protein IIB36_01345 [Gemmatimonadetes bacterium]|nr:hypothetical protein [Gemmatimonadota bacterium]